MHHLEGFLASPCLGSASRAPASLDGVHGWEVPSWSALAAGLRPEAREPEAHEPGCSRQGWQQIGWKKSFARRCSPMCHPAVNRRSRCSSVPLSTRICGCGRPVESNGHHCEACGRTGVLGRRELHSRVRLRAFAGKGVELEVPVVADARRLEVVADGLPRGGVQVAIDTTLVSALRGDGNPGRGASTRDGVTLSEARRAKERVCPELVGPGARARLVRLTSCLNSQKPRPALNRSWCANAWSRRGG